MNEHLQAFIRWCAEKELIREMLWRKPTCKIRWEPFKDYPSMMPVNEALHKAAEKASCCANEQHTWAGGCKNCGDPCL